MEQLIYFVFGTIIVATLAAGFIAGAIANLFGFGFWGAAIIAAVATFSFMFAKATN